MPIPCATERATRTACAEQQDASASFSGSAHSSSVTADRARPPASSAGDRGVDPAAHRHERAAGVGRERRLRVRGAAERAVQRVGDQVGGVELARREPAQLLGDRVRADARGVEQRLALDERDGGRGRGGERAAARGLEARAGDAVALDAQRDPDEVAAGGPAGRPVVPAGDGHAAPGRRAQVLGEALAVHTAESRRAPVLAGVRSRDAGGGAGMSANLRFERRASRGQQRRVGASSHAWRSCPSAARPTKCSPLRRTTATWSRDRPRYLAGAFSEAKPACVGRPITRSRRRSAGWTSARVASATSKRSRRRPRFAQISLTWRR